MWSLEIGPKLTFHEKLKQAVFKWKSSMHLKLTFKKKFKRKKKYFRFFFQKLQIEKLVLGRKLSYVNDCRFCDGEFCFEFPWHPNRLLIYFFRGSYMLFIFNCFIFLLEFWYFDGGFHSKWNQNNRDPIHELYHCASSFRVTSTLVIVDASLNPPVFHVKLL